MYIFNKEKAYPQGRFGVSWHKLRATEKKSRQGGGVGQALQSRVHVAGVAQVGQPNQAPRLLLYLHPLLLSHLGPQGTFHSRFVPAENHLRLASVAPSPPVADIELDAVVRVGAVVLSRVVIPLLSTAQHVAVREEAEPEVS